VATAGITQACLLLQWWLPNPVAVRTQSLAVTLLHVAVRCFSLAIHDFMQELIGVLRGEVGFGQILFLERDLVALGDQLVRNQPTRLRITFHLRRKNSTLRGQSRVALLLRLKGVFLNWEKSTCIDLLMLG